MKNIVLVVLFKSDLMSSPSVNSILNMQYTDVMSDIIIWNNGPDYLNNQDVDTFIKACDLAKIKFKMYQDIRNVSLSKIYNFFLGDNFDYDFFTILDQDTELPDNFMINIAKNINYDIVCPAVYDITNPMQQHYPLSLSRTIISEGFFDAKQAITIGSGLSLSRDLIFAMKKLYGKVFDETFAFYLVDINFFYRLRQLDSVNGLCCGEVLHSDTFNLSYSEMSESTKLEHGYREIFVRLKELNKKNLINNLFFCIRYKNRTNCNMSSLFKLMKCAITKKHPRSIFDIGQKIIPDYEN